METLQLDPQTLQAFTTLARQLHTSENVIVQQAVRYYAQHAEHKKPQPSAGPTRHPKLLRHGKHRPFEPFQAIKMTGNGLTASEMVIQDRQ